MGGYKFLMRYYAPGDSIFCFGFSRGAYTARCDGSARSTMMRLLTTLLSFLAEILDHVGLLSAGNEELARFAWKTFSKWQSRSGGRETEDRKEEKEWYKFMGNFRETFSRRVKRIRFLGLFDTVNSVLRFENAWMQRSKFPYTARSSARVVRHAVAINERRAKFRQDLISEGKVSEKDHHHHFWKHHGHSGEASSARADTRKQSQDEAFSTPQVAPQTAEHEALVPDIMIDAASPLLESPACPQLKSQDSQCSRLNLAQPVMTPSLEDIRGRNYSIAGPIVTSSVEELRDHSQASRRSQLASYQRKFSSQDKKQDIEGVWFPGCHADIGGGWPKREGETWMLSHAPLVWMVQEAERAGLKLDPYKMAKLNCCPDALDEYGNEDQEKEEHFHNAIHEGCRGFIHDSLQYGGGLPRILVLSWKIMEYLPFRRMDLRPDGSWKAIRWPLPAGETRDIPADAKIHHTAIKRMIVDETYRPGNLIVGGGGRVAKIAPAEAGTGQWKVVSNEGDPVRETYIRMHPINEKI